MRRLLRTSTLPPPYWADIPVYDDRTEATTNMSFPMLLPHEMLAHLIKGGANLEDLCSIGDPQMESVRRDVAKQVGAPLHGFVVSVFMAMEFLVREDSCRGVIMELGGLQTGGERVLMKCNG